MSKTFISAFAALSISVLACSGAIAFDLGNSTSTYQAPPAAANGSVTINVGGHMHVVNSGSKLTAGELAAVQQVLSTGAQSLNLDAAGVATGGRFALNQLPTAVLDSLAIPRGVMVINDFAASAGKLDLSGNLTNLGSFFAVSTNSAVSTANIAAANIYNGTNALLTSVLPASGLSGYANAISNLNLSLDATSVVNRGTISSAGSLGFTGTNVNVDNAGGKLIAATAINFGNAATSNVTVRGGDLLSNTVNIQAANVAQVNVGQLTGAVSVSAADLHLIASTAQLSLSHLCLTGDPQIYNTGGDVLLTGDTSDPNTSLVTNGAPIDIIASGNILIDPTSPTAVNINTSGGSVRMIAGEDFIPHGSNDPTLIGPSATGGKIDLTGSPGLASFDTGGGAASLTANGGSAAGSGSIILPPNIGLTAGALSINGAQVGTESLGPITATGDLSLSGGTIQMNGSVHATGDISMTVNTLQKEADISGRNITVTAYGAQDLHIQGNALGPEVLAADWTATGTINWVVAGDNAIIVGPNSHQNLTAAQSNLIAAGLGPIGSPSAPSGPRIEVQAHSIVHSHDPVTIYSQQLIVPDEDPTGQEETGVEASPLKMISPTGRATMQSDGDINLTSNILAPGQNVAIIAAGNITASSKVNMIDTSNTKGQSGNVLVMAGFHSMSNGSQNNPIYTVDQVSTQGGSVLLPNVSIKTSNGFVGPDEENAGSVAGSVTVVAHAGNTNIGSILLKDITTKGTSFDAHAGNVLLIGQGGVKTGNIDASATYAASVEIDGAEPQIINGSYTVRNGLPTGGGIITAKAPNETNGAAIDTGKINVSTLFARAGNVTLTSDSSINVHGDITGIGQRSLQHLSPDPLVDGDTATAGAVVNISSLADNVTINGTIDVSGAKKLGEVTNDPHGGANAGIINISSPANILITGNLKAVGGPTIGLGHAGNGGTISLVSTDAFLNGTQSSLGGTVQINGYIDAHGANGRSGANPGPAGNGGTVNINFGSFIVKGAVGGMSIDAHKGAAASAAGSAGAIGSVTLQSYSVQALPTNFNLLSGKATEVALPGGKLTVGTKNQFNGVTGGIATDTLANALKTGTYTRTASPGIHPPNLSVTVTGATTDIYELTSSDQFGSNLTNQRFTMHPGDLITPARAAALFTVTHSPSPDSIDGQTILVDHQTGEAIDLNPNSHIGGDPLGAVPAVVNADQSQVRQTFSSFVLDTMNPSGNIQLVVIGARPSLNLSASTNTSIRGQVGFTTSQSTALVNFGTKVGTTKAPVFQPQGGIGAAGDSALVLSFASPSFRNTGVLTADRLQLLTTGKTFTFTNAGIVGATRVVVNNQGTLPALTFQSIGAEFDSAFSGENGQLPLAYGAVAAQQTLPVAPSRDINLTLQMSSLLSTPLGVLQVPATSSITGTLDATNVKIVALGVPGANKSVIPMNLDFGDANVTATGGNVQVLASGSISGGNGNSFTSNAVFTGAKSAGGGIQFGVGITSSTALTALLNSKNPSGISDASVLGDNVNWNHPNGGIIAIQGKNPPPIDLSSSGANAATINQNGGVILFSSPTNPTPNNSINFDGVNITTNRVQPVSLNSEKDENGSNDYVVDVDDNF